MEKAIANKDVVIIPKKKSIFFRLMNQWELQL
ncbi:hypothetical protein J2S14_003549, partial [Lederbergia wuyishanensis]|nr:hypothetical protein [Lederbergia wuyishanensis]